MGAGEREPSRPGERRPDPGATAPLGQAEAVAAELRGRAEVVAEILLPAATLLAQIAPEPAGQLLRDLEEVARRHPPAAGVERLVGAVAAELDAG
ncbi:MAG: hypothetical protein M3N16_06145 [Actinomycetota bacterium]|nr:hypothetical protein [Actinomycetota bacterium]